MNYTPKTEEQLAKESLLPHGTYDFEIIETSDRPSKKGNDMIMLKLAVYNGDDMRIIYDYIVPSTNFGERKLRKAAHACGLLGIYMSGDLNYMTFLGTMGKAVIGQQDGTTDYPSPKNVVSEYLMRDDNESTQTKKTSKEIIDDDIPF